MGYYNKYGALPQSELEEMFLKSVRTGGKSIIQAGAGDTSATFQIDRKPSTEEMAMAKALMVMDPDKWIPLLGGFPITQTRATFQGCGRGSY